MAFFEKNLTWIKWDASTAETARHLIGSLGYFTDKDEDEVDVSTLSTIDIDEELVSISVDHSDSPFYDNQDHWKYFYEPIIRCKAGYSLLNANDAQHLIGCKVEFADSNMIWTEGKLHSIIKEGASPFVNQESVCFRFVRPIAEKVEKFLTVNGRRYQLVD